MKTKLFSFILLSSFFSFSQSVSTLPAYESFDYTIGTKLIEDDATVGIGFWSTTGPRAGDILVAESPTWSTISGIDAPTGNAIEFSGSGLKPEFLFTPQTDSFGTIYASFLMKVTDVTSLDEVSSRFFGFGKENSSGTISGATHVFVRKSGDGYNLGSNATNSTTGVVWDTTVYTVDQELMIVIYHDDTNSTSDSKMWINPVINGTEPTALIVTGPRDLDIDRVQIYQHSSSNTPAMFLDEIRVGKTWQEVTKPSVLSVEKQELVEVEMYPNPINGTNALFVNPNSSNEKEVTIYNVLGKKVLKSTVISEAVDVSGLTSGIYFLTVLEDRKIGSKKLVIK